MYNEQTYEVIKERILRNMNVDLDKREGSFLNNMVSPLGAELTRSYMEFSNILNIMFVKNSYDEYLDLKCLEWGIIRKDGKKAKGTITFTGNDGIVVTNGTECRTDSGLTFVTVDEGIIKNGKVVLAAESVENGLKYNISPNLIIEAVYTIPGVNSLTNEVGFSGGLDKESDEELIKRFYHKVRTPAISGNIYHYQEWATSIPGVKNARVIPLWDGPGTVKVIITDENNKPLSNEIISECKEYIESVRPMGAEVTVTTPGTFNINVSVTVEVRKGYSLESIKEIIKDGINEYLIESNGEIKYTKIGSLISSAKGVEDYGDLLLNGKTENISITSDYSAQLNSLILNGGS